MTEMISALEAAEKWGISKRRVQKLCSDGRIFGSKKVGNAWQVPSSAPKPFDGRADRYRGSVSISNEPVLTSIDLFSGPGGLATGFRWAGIKALIAVEWSDWTVKTYSRSHNAEIFELDQYLSTPSYIEPFLCPSSRTLLIHGDINKVEGALIKRVLRERFGRSTVDVVTGGAPCESFSMAGDRKEVDDRNHLYQNVLRIAREVDSRMFIFENVKGLFSKKMDGKPGAMYQAICDEFESEDESCPGVKFRLASREKSDVLLFAPSYGVPQARERLFLVGLNEEESNLHFEYPIGGFGPGKPYPFVSVSDAISDLPSVEVGCECNKYRFNIEGVEHGTARSLFLRRMRGDLSMPPDHLDFDESTLTSHKAPGHTKKMIERIKRIKRGENMKTASQRLVSEGRESEVADYFPNKIYAARNRRLRLDCPSFTVTSHCLDEMIHPTANRGLSPREAARLQSFPDWYIFEGPYVKFHSDPDPDQYEQIGDAIPPLLAYALGKQVAESLVGLGKEA